MLREFSRLVRAPGRTRPGVRRPRVLAALLAVLVVGALAPASALADASLTGTVTSSATGNGIPGVTVSVYTPGASTPFATMLTGTGGTFVTGSLTPGSYQVQFDGTALGYSSQWYNGASSQSSATQIVVSGNTITPTSANASLTPDSVSGQVVDQHNQNGIPGVTVALVNSSSKQVATTTTDLVGNYSFSAFPPGTGYTVQASQPTNSPYTGGSSSAFTVPAGQSVTGETVPLTPDSVSGTVVGLNGIGVPNVDVALVNSSSQNVALATTDASGNYSFSAIPPGTGYTIQFNPGGASAGYSSSTSFPFTVTAGQATQGIDGTVFRAGELSGKVLSSTGAGVQGVSVNAYDAATGNSYSATTASDGTYALDGLPTGSYTVEFAPPSGQHYLYQWYPGKSDPQGSADVPVTSGQATTGINATLATGGTISGTVFGHGAPLAGVAVDLYTASGSSVSYDSDPTQLTTDQNGNYSFTGLRSGDYEVEFNAPNNANYVSQYYNGILWTGTGGSPTPIPVHAGSTTSGIDATLQNGGEVTGTVTDASGRPVPGVDVQIYDGTGGNGYGSATTGQDGTYTVMGLPESANYRVYFEAPNGSTLANAFYTDGSTLASATPVPVTVGQTTANINEVLPQGGSISGKVLDTSGNPIGDTELYLTDANGNEVPGFWNTQQDGNYDITNLAPGTYKLEFAPMAAYGFQFYNGGTTLASATPITVSAGQTTANVNGALPLGGEVTGTVTSAATGAALPGEEVDLVDSSGNFLDEAFTDANGQYTITGIPTGTYYVEFPRHVDFISVLDGTVYAVQFYSGKTTLAGSTPVSVTGGSTTANINAALVPESASSSTGQTQGDPSPDPGATGQNSGGTTKTTTPSIGPPTISGGSISALAKKQPTVVFKLSAGNGAPKLTSFTIKLPAGLSFAAGKLKGVSVRGGGKVTEKLIGGELAVHLGTQASTLSVSIPASALKVSQSLAQKAKNHRIASLTVVVSVTRSQGPPAAVSFLVKKPH